MLHVLRGGDTLDFERLYTLFPHFREIFTVEIHSFAG
jgi:hypothetical protein